jgi:hypothetical protein
MKVACKKTTSIIDGAALEQSVKQRRAHLGNKGRSFLDGCYLDAMVDCIATTPHTKNDVYSKKTSKIASMMSGILSSARDPCPNLYKIVQQSSVKWDSNQPLRHHFWMPFLNALLKPPIVGLSLRMYLMICGFQKTRTDIRIGSGTSWSGSCFW